MTAIYQDETATPGNGVAAFLYSAGLDIDKPISGTGQLLYFWSAMYMIGASDADKIFTFLFFHLYGDML